MNKLYAMTNLKGIFSGFEDSVSWSTINEGLDSGDYAYNTVDMVSGNGALWLALGPYESDGTPKGLWKREKPKSSNEWTKITTFSEPINSGSFSPAPMEADLYSRALYVGDGHLYFARATGYPIDQGIWIYHSANWGGMWENRQLEADYLGYALSIDQTSPNRRNCLCSNSISTFTLTKASAKGSVLVDGNGWIEIPYNYLLNFSTNFTLVIWVKPTQNNQTCHLLSRPGNYELGLNNGYATITLWDSNGNSATYTHTTIPITVGGWWGIRVTANISSPDLDMYVYDDANSTVYSKDFNPASAWTPASNLAKLYIGSKDGETNFFKGYVAFAEAATAIELLHAPYGIWVHQLYGYSLTHTSGGIALDDKGPYKLHGAVYGDAQWANEYGLWNSSSIPYQFVIKETGGDCETSRFWTVYDIQTYGRTGLGPCAIGITIDDNDNLYAYGEFSDGNILKTFDYITWITWGEFLDAGDYVTFLLPTGGSLYAFSKRGQVWYKPSVGTWERKTDIPDLASYGEVTCGINPKLNHLIVGITQPDVCMYETLDGGATWSSKDSQYLVMDDVLALTMLPAVEARTYFLLA